MRKENLRPWMQKITWIVPVIGVFLIIASPVVAPLVILWRNRTDFIEYYSECFEVLQGVDK